MNRIGLLANFTTIYFSDIYIAHTLEEYFYYFTQKCVRLVPLGPNLSLSPLT